MGREPQIVRLQVDYRERGSRVPEALLGTPRVELTWAQLEAGDYVAGSLAVERKRCDDLASSIQDRRLFVQVDRLRDLYDRVVVLIEGPDLYGASHLHPNALRGAISYLAVLAGVSVVRSEDAADSAALIATMARHALYGLGYELDLHRKPSSADPDTQVRYVIQQLPGIGPALAEALWARFGTARALLNATQTALQDVPGIGPQRASQIVDLLTRAHGTVTTEGNPRPSGAAHLEETER